MRQRCQRIPVNWLITLGLAVLVVVAFASAALAESPVTLIVDGQLLHTDVPPEIRNGRTLVPVRAIAEELGLEVEWDGATRQVLLRGDDLEFVLTVESRTAHINNQVQYLDAAPIIVAGRTLVPVRLVAESMGCAVAWNGVSRTVTLSSRSATDVGPLLLDMRALPLGQQPGAVLEDWGAPYRKDAGFFGIEWWNYRQGNAGLVRFGFRQDRLVAAYALGNRWQYGAARHDVAPATVAAELSGPAQPTLTVGRAEYEFECGGEAAERGMHAPVMERDRVTLLYRDDYDSTTPAVLVMEPDTFVRSNPVSRTGCRVWYATTAPLPGDITLSPSDQLGAARGEARVLVDLANVDRALHDMGSLTWNGDAAGAALGHSQDMESNDFFAHESPTQGTVADRLQAEGFSGCSVAENIAMGYVDAISVHHAWMTSQGHRVNLLNPGLREFGAGVVDSYYTEDFLACR